MRMRILLAAACFVVAGEAAALNPVTWTIDETINRGETQRFWTSPTAIDLGLDAYNWSYNVSAVTATILASPFDVTALIGESFPLSGMGQAAALPFVVVDQALAEPITGTSADVLIEVDALGFGQAAITNAVFGVLDLGTPLDIEAIRIEATVSVEGITSTPGDFNSDGRMDNVDLNLLLANWGATTLPPAWTGYFVGPSVDNEELNFLLVNWGAGVAAPEPTTGWLAGLALLGSAPQRRRCVLRF